MKKLIISVSILVAVVSCKGPGSGPLAKEAYKENATQAPAMSGKSHGGQVTAEKMAVAVEPGEGCLTIAKLMETKKALSGKTVKVKGKVVKFNPEIMGKNWVHLQDGSEFEGIFDLTVTTDGKVNIGDIVTIEGTITLDKDFGYGYSYSILMENGKVVL